MSEGFAKRNAKFSSISLRAVANINNCIQYNLRKSIASSDLFSDIILSEDFYVKRGYYALLIHKVPHKAGEDKALAANTLLKITEEVSVILKKEERLEIIKQEIIKCLFISRTSTKIKFYNKKQALLYALLLRVSGKINDGKMFNTLYAFADS